MYIFHGSITALFFTHTKQIDVLITYESPTCGHGDYWQNSVRNNLIFLNFIVSFTNRSCFVCRCVRKNIGLLIIEE